LPPTHRSGDIARTQWLQTHLVTLSFRLNQVLNSVLNQGTGFGSVQMAPGYCPTPNYEHNPIKLN